MKLASGRPPLRGPPFFFCLLAFFALPALAEEEYLDEEDTGPRYAIPTRIDRIGRIVLPVFINERGPYPFVLDTGANITVITPRLAEALEITVEPERLINLHGVTGAAPFPTAFVSRVESGAIHLRNKRLAVANATAVGTDGILGMDGLAHKVVLVDFVRDQVRVLDAARHRPSPQLTRIPARIRFKRLLVVDALVNGRKADAVIDSGGQRTLGNQALFDALGLKPAAPSLNTTVEVVGATDARQRGERRVINDIKIGDLRTVRLAVTFGDFYIFKAWELTEKPALVIGMDMIGVLHTFGVDYLRREIQFRVH